ncbi:hypothetical protein [Streptomyces sp. S.PB5]|uniref:hypothetical protein n=1 Tax=Streptomyces sp. S.PB5 TaxID=3020844 RepID=UPI0025B0B794|nr:hypothetical protein [Streptomyces sp. S.PB5]MDN3021557.1 hypothetical protein [Streptomyces sp. S.PB5]
MPTPYTRPAPPNGPGICTRCGAHVIWCLNANRNTQAVNAQRVDYGNQAVRQDAAGRWHVRQLTKERPTLEGSEALHYPHAPTCTNPAPRPAFTPGIPRGRRGVRPVRWQR